MPDGVAAQTLAPLGRIGPNAILQLVEPVENTLGQDAMRRLLATAHASLPDGKDMVDESDVALIHQALYRLYPEQAQDIARTAGEGTARYICANRIPAPARLILRLAPAKAGERLLTRAIAEHAWTFCGSGYLEVHFGHTIRFELHNNPMQYGVHSKVPMCSWHAAVFQELFSSLLRRPYAASETSCCAMGSAVCSFEVAAS